MYLSLFGGLALLWIFIPSLSFAQWGWDSCTLPWGWTLYHGESISWWKINQATYTETCASAVGTLTCNNWVIEGWRTIYKYASCVQPVWKNCTTNWGIPVKHLEYFDFYSLSESTYTTTCTESQARFQCLDWNFVSQNGYDIDYYSFETCNERRNSECLHPWQEQFVANGGTVVGYSSITSSDTKTCEQLKVTLTCSDGNREWWNPNAIYSGCNDLGFKDCTENNTNYFHGWSGIYYSNLTSIYPKRCVDIGSMFSCINGTFIGDFNQYPYESCIDGLPADCKIGTSVVPHSWTVTAYSQPEVLFPKTCEQISTKLSCNNWAIVGNRNVFKYLGCQVTGGLVDGVDLRLEIKLLGGTLWFAQYSSPAFDILIKNRWTNLINGTNVNPGFLTCYWHMDNWQKLIVYQSKKLVEFTLNPGTSLKQTIVLKDLFTQSLGDKKISCELKKRDSETDLTNNTRSGTLAIIKAERFDIAMNRAIDSIRTNLDAPEILSDVSATPGADAVKDFLMKKIMDVLVPLIITIGILISLLGFYKIFFSSDEKAVEEGIKYITYGVIGIIIIMSAKFISTAIYSNIFQEWILGYGSVQGYEIAQKLYEKIAFPFIKLAIYLALWVLFVILASRALTFVFGTDEDAKKKAGTIIAWNVLGMFIIIWAKQVIEFIYWKQQDVVKAVSNLGEIGSGLLANKNLPLLYEIINWAMGLAALVILIMVLVQAFSLLLKPDSPDAMKKIKNSLLYIFIGILIIGTGYIITNFLIIN